MFGRWWRLAGALALACAATPQDLPPEVLLLSRIKRHLRDELARIPNYTCLETISRFRDDPKSRPQYHAGLMRQDTVRLEIVYSEGREWYGSPGDRNLSKDHPVAFIAGGMIGDGAFALTMNNIVEGGIFTYSGEETLDGRTAVKYDFRVPRLLKPLYFSVYGGAGTVGEGGSVWVDPQSLDLIRVESHAVEIPPSLPLQEASMSVDYSRMRIGGSDAMLAQQAGSSMLDFDGVRSYNHMEFTHCRSYTATSEISFDSKPSTPDEAASAPSRQAAAGPAVPAFLEVTMLLTTPVSDQDSVGSLIEAKTSGNVVHKGKVVVPDGSVVRGRIRRLERWADRDAFGVGLEFSDVEAGGAVLPFYADLLRVDKDKRIQPALSQRILVHVRTGIHPVDETITLTELPGVASFFVKGATFKLPSGFRMVWRTRGLIH